MVLMKLLINNNFFNKGTKEQWLEKLSNEQIYRIEKNYYTFTQAVKL